MFEKFIRRLKERDKSSQLIRIKKDFDVLVRVSEAVNTLAGKEDLMETIVDATVDAMDVEAAAVYLRADTDISQAGLFCSGKEADMIRHFQGYIYNEIIDWVIKKNKPLMITDTEGQLELADEAKSYTVHSMMCNPVVSKDKVSGALLVFNKIPYPRFSDNDISLFFAIAGQAAMATENASLYEESLKRVEELSIALENTARLSSFAEVAAGLVHDIRTPLTTISGFLQVLGEKHEDKAFVNKFIEVNEQEIDRLNGLVEQYLMGFRDEVHSDREKKQNYADICILINEVVSLVSGMKKYDIEYENKLENDYMVASPARIKGVLVNLVVNAVQAMPDGGSIKVKTELDKDSMLIIIEDSGKGIAREHLPKVFDMFFTTKKNGSGIGLYTCRKVIESVKGEISIKSVENKGTQVLVKIPWMRN